MTVDRDAHLRAIRQRSENDLQHPEMLGALDETVARSQFDLFHFWKLSRGIQVARKLWYRYFPHRSVPE